MQTLAAPNIAQQVPAEEHVRPQSCDRWNELLRTPYGEPGFDALVKAAAAELDLRPLDAFCAWALVPGRCTPEVTARLERLGRRVFGGTLPPGWGPMWGTARPNGEVG